MKVLTGLLPLLLLAAACNQASKPANTNTPATDTAMKATVAAPKYEAALVDNKKDPSCGMPVTAGIEDTLHYKGKVLGFCSKECKDAFVEKPDSFVVVYK